MGEGYKPTYEEIAKAEGTLDQNQKSMSDVREEELGRVESESGLEKGVFDEIVQSFHLKSPQESGTDFYVCSFRIKGHNITLMQKQLPLGAGGPAVISIDNGNTLNMESEKRFMDKYRSVLYGLGAMGNEKMKKLSEQAILDELL